MPDDDSEDPLEEPLTDVRRLVDHQVDLVEQGERELLRIVRLNLLLLGGIVPAVQLLRSENSNLLRSLWPGLPWFLVAVLLFALAIVFASLTYRGKLLYGGFEDSPNFRVAHLTGKSPGEATANDFPGNEAFEGHSTESEAGMRAHLLWDYAKGTRHNNRETSYRYRIVNRINQMMAAGIIAFVAGAMVLLSGGSFGGTAFYGLAFVYIAYFVVSLLLVKSAVKGICDFVCREEDPYRFTVGDYDEHHDIDVGRNLLPDLPGFCEWVYPRD